MGLGGGKGTKSARRGIGGKERKRGGGKKKGRAERIRKERERKDSSKRADP